KTRPLAGFFVDAGLAEANCSFDKLCSKQSLDAKAQRRRPEGGSTREATALRSIVPGAPSAKRYLLDNNTGKEPSR
ncbi:MAG: hypothetical protein VW373_10155, partial [Halieaceae bacterium]